MPGPQSFNQQKATSGLVQTIKRVTLSWFVVFTFLIYAIRDQRSPDNASAAVVVPTEHSTESTKADPQSPTATVVVNGLKDGSYVGASVDAYFGNVQVKATVQSGRLTDVEFLDYPHDRRTSQRINSFANPALQREAIQAQNANVNIISGATLTSEGFIQSLQSALDKAKA